jgi:feruloyl-CoA synthase
MTYNIIGEDAMNTEPMRFRPVHMGSMAARAEPQGGGVVDIVPLADLGPYPRSTVDAIEEWASRTPDALMIADRDGDVWRRLSYAEVMARLPPLGQALIEAGLSAERPLLILSGNEIEHLLLGLAAIWAGIPHAPVSPAYSLVSTDFGKLRHIVETLTPGLVYATSGARYERAIRAVIGDDIPLVVRRDPLPDRKSMLFEELAATVPGSAVAAAHAGIGPGTIAKILFTSGSTGLPKGVITTNRMMASNQQMIRTALRFLCDEPPVLLDWMPWNHVAGGSHNTGIAFHNGGSFYIDDGAPTPDRIGRTYRNLAEVRPTFYSNVPKGYEYLAAEFARDAELSRGFFERLKLLQYAGANMAQHVFEGLERAARSVSGERVMIITGYGSTETSPFAFTTTWPVERSGHIGLPAAGMRARLVPNGDKIELRLKGPNVTPGYWRDPEKTSAAFDADGFYRIGDAVRWADPDDLGKGFLFDGRVSEDFKLSTGTWVNFAALRAAVVAACAPLIRDVVLTGQDADFIGALIFPDLGACAELAGLSAGADASTILAHPRVVGEFRARLAALAAAATGSSSHIARALLLAAPPQIDTGEVTDKGSINQRAVLAARALEAASLYADPPPPGVLVLPRREQIR